MSKLLTELNEFGKLTINEPWPANAIPNLEHDAHLAHRYHEALERIEGHTSRNVAPGTPPPDPRWINAIATAALEGE